jgi:plastocyanin
MNRLRVAAVALVVAAAATAGYALAAGVSVSLTATGPQPNTVSVNWGDTVTYTNGDSVEHAVTIPREEVASPAIPPGGTFEHVFDGRGGNVNFVQVGKRNHAGRVVVRVEGTVTLNASSPVVPFGKSLTLSGRSPYPGTPVVVRGRDAGAGGDLKVFIQAAADDAGSYSGRIRPTVGARIQARVAADQLASKIVSFAVRPRITISASRRTAPAGGRIVVSGKIAPASAADRAELVAYDTRRKRWVTVETRATANGKVAFRLEVEEGATRVRISVARGSIAAGYAPADSRFVRIVGTKKTP